MMNQSKEVIPTSEIHAANLKKRKLLTEEEREKRNAKRRAIPMIKLVKNDVRRFFASMLVNIINSCDSQLVGSFIATYCSHYGRMISYTKKYIFDSSFKPLQVLEGREAILDFTGLFHKMSPDLVVRLHSTQIRTRSNNSMTIIGNITYSGTRIFGFSLTNADYRLMQLLDQGNTILRTQQGLRAVGPNALELESILQEKEALAKNPNRSNDLFMGSEDQPKLIRLPSPIKLELPGFLILQVGEDGKIGSVDLVDTVESPEQYIPSLHSPDWRIQRVSHTVMKTNI